MGIRDAGFEDQGLGMRDWSGLRATASKELPIGMLTTHSAAASTARRPDSSVLTGAGGTVISSCDSTWAPERRCLRRTAATIGRIERLVYVARVTRKPAASRRRERALRL